MNRRTSSRVETSATPLSPVEEGDLGFERDQPLHRRPAQPRRVVEVDVEAFGLEDGADGVLEHTVGARARG